MADIEANRQNGRQGLVDGGNLVAERIGPEPENEDMEPHCPPLGEGSLDEDGKYPTETVGAEGADSAIQASDQWTPSQQNAELALPYGPHYSRVG
jgi:hypothetical protein